MWSFFFFPLLTQSPISLTLPCFCFPFRVGVGMLFLLYQVHLICNTWMITLSFYFKLQPFMSSHVKYIHIKNDIIYLQSFNDTSLALILLFHLIITRISWLQPKQESLHFILSNNNNYDFDIKVRLYGFVGFVNYVIDCEMCTLFYN